MTRTSGRRATEVPGSRVDTDQGGAELLRDADRRAAWMLLIDGVPQSHVDLDDPEYLDFEYVRRLGHVIDTAAPPAQPLDVLHLGAGALTLARYVTATRPGSGQLAVEIDAALVDLIRLKLPLRRVSPSRRTRNTQGVPAGQGVRGDGADVRRSGGARHRPVRIRVGDAREVLEQLPMGSFDVVIVDAFAAGRTPAHLTSVEFAAAARRVLRGGQRAGVFAANVADGAPLAHARAQVANALAVFSDACLIADAAVLRGRRFGNLVLAASADPLPVSALTRLAAADPMPGRVMHGDELIRFAAGAKPVTDASASPSPAPPPDAFAP